MHRNRKFQREIIEQTDRFQEGKYKWEQLQMQTLPVQYI